MIDDDTLGNLDGVSQLLLLSGSLTPGVYVLFLGIAFMMAYGFGRTEHRGDRSRINQPLGLGYDRNESSHNSQLLYQCIFRM